MNILFYCQYVWGMGHFFRSLELAKALVGHHVVLVAGGREVHVDLPGHITLSRLPALYMDEAFTTLFAGDSDRKVEDIQRQRRKLLVHLFETFRPDVFVVELYPFGRTAFGFELDPILEQIRGGLFGSLKCVCSLRDILVEKRDAKAYEERVLNKLNGFFDVLLVHSDPNIIRLEETFARVDDIRIPVVHTGFVAPRLEPDAGLRLRQELGVSSAQSLIVASAGGGRSGFPLLSCVLDAARMLRSTRFLRLEVFAGPFMDQAEYEKLTVKAGDNVRVRRFTDRFLDYLGAADLSVSLAGYNTCMNLLVTGVPCLVHPYSRQREQPLRVQRLQAFIPMQLIQTCDLEPHGLSRQMEYMLAAPRSQTAAAPNVDGAANTARYLTGWAGGGG
jgi:predicted glycosyltransferase